MNNNIEQYSEDSYRKLITQIENHPDWSLLESDHPDPETSTDAKIARSGEGHEEEYIFTHDDTGRWLAAFSPSYAENSVTALRGSVASYIAQFRNPREDTFPVKMAEGYQTIAENHQEAYTEVTEPSLDAALYIEVPFEYEPTKLDDALTEVSNGIADIEELHGKIYSLLDNPLDQ